jgi:hypothetical protein
MHTFFFERNQTTQSIMTEATLLRAMETAGKQVDDEDYTMKENELTSVNQSTSSKRSLEDIISFGNKKQVLPTPTDSN